MAHVAFKTLGLKAESLRGFTTLNARALDLLLKS